MFQKVKSWVFGVGRGLHEDGRLAPDSRPEKGCEKREARRNGPSHGRGSQPEKRTFSVVSSPVTAEGAQRQLGEGLLSASLLLSQLMLEPGPKPLGRDPRPHVSRWGEVCWSNDWVKPCVYLMDPGSFFLPLVLHFPFSLSCIGEGNGSPLQCSCLENPRDGGAWWAAVYGIAQSRTRLKRLSSSSNAETCYILYFLVFYLSRYLFLKNSF